MFVFCEVMTKRILTHDIWSKLHNCLKYEHLIIIEDLLRIGMLKMSVQIELNCLIILNSVGHKFSIYSLVGTASPSFVSKELQVSVSRHPIISTKTQVLIFHAYILLFDVC